MPQKEKEARPQGNVPLFRWDPALSGGVLWRDVSDPASGNPLTGHRGEGANIPAPMRAHIKTYRTAKIIL